MRVLITGATGFLGSRVAERLCSRQVEVRVLVRPTSDRYRLRGLAVEPVIGDVCDRASVIAALRGVDTVVHAAAHYELGTPDPGRMEAVNVGGTRHVLEAAADAGIAALHVSSVAALGPTGPDPVDETHWGGGMPGSAYEATKRAAHELASGMAAHGARVWTVMPGTIYGPDDPSLVGRLHAAATRFGLPVGILPDMRMSLVYVDDCAEGIALILGSAMTATSVVGPAMTATSVVGSAMRATSVVGPATTSTSWILSADVVTFRAWFDALARIGHHGPPVVWLPPAALRPSARLLDASARLEARLPRVARRGFALAREGLAMADGHNWAFSGAKAVRELGWRPRPLDQGLRETLAWYRRPQPGGGARRRRR